MKYAQDLLTRVKAAHGVTSARQTGFLLDISYQAVRCIEKGENGISDVTLNKIAHLLGENPMLLIANYHIETNDFPGMNNVWLEMKRLAELEEIHKHQTVTSDGIGNVSGL